MANEQQKLTVLVHNAAAQLEAQQYNALMGTLISLGELIEKDINHNYSNQGFDGKATEVRLVLDKLLGENYEKLAVIHNAQAFRAFEAAWEEADLAKDADESERHLALKASLNKSTRHKVKMGLLALAHLALLHREAAEKSERDVRAYNEKAAEAIRSYKTTGQKVLAFIADFFTAGAAFTFGITTFAAVMLLPLSWPFVVVLGLAAVIGVAGSIVNWNIFRKPVFHFLNDIMGKDKPFQGFFEYVNEQGKKVVMSLGKKIAVGVSALFSLSVGAALGALTYSSVLGLAPILATVGVAASFLPPVAIGLAIVAFVCLTALMLNAFSGMLKTDDVSSIFTKPFKAVADVFDENDPRNKNKRPLRLKVERGITYAITGALTVLGMFGLGMFSWACAGALTQMLSATLGAVPVVATAVGYTVGLFAAGIGQIPFILSASGQAVANIASKFCDLFAPKDPAAVVAPPVKTTFTEKLNSLWNGALVVINAVGNGLLVVPSLIGSGLALAGSAAAASFYNSFSAGASSFKAPGAGERRQEEVSSLRLQRVMGKAAAPQNDAVADVAPLLVVVPKPARPDFQYSALMFQPRGGNPGPRDNENGSGLILDDAADLRRRSPQQ